MGRNRDVIVTGITFLPPTSVRVFSVNNVDGAAVLTFFLFSAGLGGSMERQALRTVKWKMALVADGGGLLEHVVVWTRIGLVPVARAAGSALAGVVCSIILIIATVALVAPITLIDEASDGGTPLVMIV